MCTKIDTWCEQNTSKQLKSIAKSKTLSGGPEEYQGLVRPLTLFVRFMLYVDSRKLKKIRKLSRILAQ